MRRLLGLWLRFAAWCSRGPIPAGAPWLGTMGGGFIVSGSAGNAGLVVLGAAVGAVGVLPVIAAAHWAEIDRRIENRADARERMTLEFSRRLLQRAASVPPMTRSRRIGELRAAARETVEFLVSKLYESRPAVRTVVYEVADDGRALVVLDSGGRPDVPGSFVQDSEEGEAVFPDLLDPAGHVRRSAPEGKTYAEYLAAPIRTAGRGLGMLTVDSAGVDDFDPADGPLLEILSSALAIFFAEAVRGARSP